jgi:hypothetical protein
MLFSEGGNDEVVEGIVVMDWESASALFQAFFTAFSSDGFSPLMDFWCRFFCIRLVAPATEGVRTEPPGGHAHADATQHQQSAWSKSEEQAYSWEWYT